MQPAKRNVAAAEKKREKKRKLLLFGFGECERTALPGHAGWGHEFILCVFFFFLRYFKPQQQEQQRQQERLVSNHLKKKEKKRKEEKDNQTSLTSPDHRRDQKLDALVISSLVLAEFFLLFF